MSVFKVKDNNDQWVTVSTGGVGVPAGGSTAQVLVKASNADYSTRWSEQVHVGGNPPTDEGVAIWLDTDEAGMSAVSSVNAKTGTVVLDADDVGGMSKWVLLWENASPTSSFAAQTVALDLSGYDLVAVIFDLDMNVGVGATFIYYVGGTLNATMHPLGSTNVTAVYSRTAKLNTDSVVFSGGWWNTTSENNAMIPYQIYGIKGVKTT